MATEFVGGSVSSVTELEVNAIVRTGLGHARRARNAGRRARRAAGPQPWYSELDYLHHGYVVCEASKSSFKATFSKLRTVRRRSTALASSKTYTCAGRLA